jgi:hypothetical protein
MDGQVEPESRGDAGYVVYPPGGRASAPGGIAEDLLRYVTAVGCIIVPFIFLAIFQWTMHASNTGVVSIPPGAIAGASCASGAGAQTGPSAELRSFGIRAADISGRYAYAIPSAALRFVAVVAVGFSFFVIFRRATPMVGALTCAASLGLGLLLAFAMPHDAGTRKTLVLPIAKSAGTGMDEYLSDSVVWNEYFGVAAVVVVLCALGVVAIRARDQELKPEILRQRLFDLRWLMIVAATVLVMTVIITRALVDWHLAFLCDDYAQRLKPVGAALANYWGAGSSGVLLAAFLPAYFSWNRDVVRWARRTKPDGSEKDRRSLIGGECLDFAPSTSATTLLTMAVPALSGPLLELMKGLLEKVG